MIYIKEKQLFTIKTQKEAKIFVLHNQLMQGSMLLKNEPKDSSLRQTVRNIRDDLKKELRNDDDKAFLKGISTIKRSQGRFETKSESILSESQEEELPYWEFKEKEAILV